MTTLIFFVTIISLFVLFIRLIIIVIKHKPVSSTIRAFVIIVLSYSILWGIFYFVSGYKVVPPGTDICFDDWCATVTKTERPETLGSENQVLKPKGQFIILYINMSNKAKGIAQKPSEPRIHIIDEKGNSYSYSPEGQLALEKQKGKQIPIDERLELHQSLETKLVFDVPKDAKGLKALIEEGPFITRLLFNENKEVFLIP